MNFEMIGDWVEINPAFLQPPSPASLYTYVSLVIYLRYLHTFY